MGINHGTKSGGHTSDIFSIFFILMVYCVFSLESPYTIYHFQYKKETQIYTCEIFSFGLKNEFETAMVNEPSV